MFLPENIDLAHSEKYMLSIRLLPNGFSFCIYLPGDPEVFFFKETSFGSRLSYLESVKKMVFDLGFLSQVFRKTEVVVVSDRFTLVPAPLFEAKEAKEVFRFNFLCEGDEDILHNWLCDGTLSLIFGLDEELHAFLLRSLWNPVFTHEMGRLIPFFMAHGKDHGRKRCYVDFQDAMAAVVCFDGDKLLSANVFSYRDASDALFYIVGVWEKHGFDQMADFLYLSGATENPRHSVDVLRKLIKNVRDTDFEMETIAAGQDVSTSPTDLKIELCG